MIGVGLALCLRRRNRKIESNMTGNLKGRFKRSVLFFFNQLLRAYEAIQFFLIIADELSSILFTTRFFR